MRQQGHSNRDHSTLTAAALTLLALLAVQACSDDDPVPPDAALPDAALAEAGVEAGADGAAGTERKLIILHTNDLHDHLMGHGPNADYTPQTTGDDTTVGGAARLAALIKQERASAKDPLLLLDGGDFSMGTIFTRLNSTSAPALSVMQALGYDAVTLGNHEFEHGCDGLADSLTAAIKAGFAVPVLASNLDLDATASGDDKLEAQVTAGVIKKKLVKTLQNGLKVGVFGLMGEEAAQLAPSSPVSFSDQVAAARSLIKELREQDKVDLVIALSHTGTSAKGAGADAKLAADAPGIDVIISGHSHKTLAQPAKVGQTLIVQTGKNGRRLGRLELTLREGAVTASVYTLVAVDDTIKGDTQVQTTIDGWITALDASLAASKLSFKKVVAETSFDLTLPYFQEAQLGDLITDAYRATYNALYPLAPAAVALESDGIIRDEVLKGKTGQIWFSDLYRALPLGLGPDGKPGYPLVDFYLNGQDLKTAAEVLALAEGTLNNPFFFLQMSGMQVEYTKAGLPAMAVTSIKVGGQAVDVYGTAVCYKVVTNLYVAEMVGLVAKTTGGLLKVEPKLQDCKTLITDMNTRIVDADPTAAGLQELKAWQALTDYVTSRPDTDNDGVPEIPAVYAKPQGRIVAK